MSCTPEPARQSYDTGQQIPNCHRASEMLYGVRNQPQSLFYWKISESAGDDASEPRLQALSLIFEQKRDCSHGYK